MNAVVATYRDEMEMEGGYALEYRRDRNTVPHRSRRPEHRRSAAPACVNGIHRRRNKRWTWGSGRGARMMSLRAMASSLVLALASLAGAALAAPLPVTIDYATVGNPGNAGLVTSTVTVQPTTGGSSTTFAQSGTWGSVSEIFKIAKYETTNADYVKFLNTVDPTGSNPNGIYNSLMTSNTVNGGILNTGTVDGARYSTRSGFDLKPVTYVSWFSAARFANWMNNGQISGTAGTETGAYSLNGATSGPLVARNPGAQVYLPNLNEFVKAAFYDPTLSGTGGYYAYGTRNNTAPTPATVGSGTNVANYGGSGATPVTTGVVDGTAFPNTTSYYGLFNAFGNVAEWSETAYSGDSTLANVNGAGWRINGNAAGAANWASSRVRYFSTAGVDSYGFRVAAVPEPGAMILAAVGLGGAFGGEYMRRRRRKSRA